MDKSLKYYVFKDKRIVFEILKGNFELNDYFDLKKAEILDKDYDPNFDFILDLRFTDFVFSEIIENEMARYIDFAKSIQVISKRRKTALITRTPEQVVNSILHQSLDDRNIDFKIFSTFEAAFKWIGIIDFDIKLIIE